LNITNLVGFILPPIIDLINRKIVDPSLRFLVSVGVCAVIGAGLNYMQHGYQFGPIEDVAGDIMVIFGQAQLAYKLAWEKSQPRVTLNLKPDNN